MAAELIPFGENAPGVGGEFERECGRALRDGLPEGFVIATNVNLPRNGTEFYEYDAIIAGPGICDVLEMKCIRGDVAIGEDSLASSTGFRIDRVLSIVNHKAKILASRRLEHPFLRSAQDKDLRVNYQVIVPSNTKIKFGVADHKTTKPVRGLSDAVMKYRKMATESTDFANKLARKQVRQSWLAYRDLSAASQRRDHLHLGRFAIRRSLSGNAGVYEHFATDEPPVQMDVHLREFPFDPVLPAKELETYLKDVARETRVLMKVRHPFVACVIGHFQTGASWVQVSDWFDGHSLDDLWPEIAELSFAEKLGIYLKVIQALQYCHEKGVFHRNLGAHSIRATADFADIRLGGFEFALDLNSTSTMTGSVLARRDPRIVAPEDLQTGRSANARLADIFQAGVLLYRLLENGNWPFASTLDYATGDGKVRGFSIETPDPGMEQVRRISLRMMDRKPELRPDLLRKVEQGLESALLLQDRKNNDAPRCRS